MAKSIALALLLLVPSTGGAEITEQSVAGFTVKNAVTVKASPDRAYRALVEEIWQWWEASHTFSGDAKNLSIAAMPGGCFCERLANGGGVMHAQVNYVAPGETLRMVGGLGPLQEHAIAGTQTWQFAKSAEGSTVTLTYSVSGFYPGGFDKISGAVDQVLGTQLQRLKAFLEGTLK